MATTCGELRETLIDAIHAVRESKIDPDQGKAIALLAAAVNANMLAEIAARREEAAAETLGQLQLGENVAAKRPALVAAQIRK